MSRASSAATVTMLGLAIVFSGAAEPRAAELQVLAGGAMTSALRDIGAQFEAASGHKLVFRFGTTPELIKLATTGGPFDIGIVPREVYKDAAAQARFTPGEPTDIARVGLGVAVRAGAAKPDIATADAMKATLLRAQSIATIPASAAGAQVLATFDRLGIGEAMKAKTKAQSAPAQIVESVAKGEAELAVFLVNVLTAPGLDLVGPFPAELQKEVIFAAALCVDAREAEAAKAFLGFLMAPAATAVIKAKGLTPG